MGGAVFTNATGRLLEKKYSVGGVTVLDVVEGKSWRYFRGTKHLIGITGSALEALPHMHKLLASRPEGFPSVEKAVEWQYV